MRFLDSCKIWVQGGNGGNGCLILPNEEGLSGGNGGKGGSVVAIAKADLTTLIDYRYRQHFRSDHGAHGQGSDCHGAKGKPLYLPLPLGTQIYSEDKSELLADLTEDGQTFILDEGAPGGRGGLLAIKKTHREGQYQAGEKRPGKWVWLQLKLIADIGVIGMPNAGKSTFIKAISRSKTKVASYPFTTIKPILATVSYRDQQVVFADIPGLIEDSHAGKGLGDFFLRHVERCAMLLHLVAGDSEDVVGDYKMIANELACYGAGLQNKKTVVVLSKTDLLSPEDAETKQRLLQDYLKTPVVLLSSYTRQGIEDLLNAAVTEYCKNKSGW